MENNICTCVNCELEIYEENDKCVLHCKKDNTYDLNDLVYKKFYEELENLLKETDNVVLNYIIFPEYDERDFDYQQMLKQLVSIHFNYCEFHTSYIDLENTKCFFQDCKFHKYWTLFDYDILTNLDNVIYQACIFYENVAPYSSEKIGEEVLYKNSQFDYTCKFEKELKFNNVKFKKPLFYSAQNNFLTDRNLISILIFDNCIFEQPFKLNNYQIDYFHCQDTVFKNKSKFEFKNNEINEFIIENTNFKSLVDCFETKFKSFKIEKSIFEKFTGFEKCEFGEDNNEKNNKAEFEYTTFLDFVNFREAEFHYGLNLKKANFKFYPNFLDIKIDNVNTNRETFRIIKYSFDAVGNSIEANKYFANEMNKERQATKLNESPSKYLSLQLNYLISDFGQSFMRPLFLILYFLCLQFLVFCLMDSWKFDNGLIRDFWIGINHIIHDFMPLKKFLVEGKEFVSLFFLIIYSTLIYNLVIAIKRITKR